MAPLRGTFGNFWRCCFLKLVMHSKNMHENFWFQILHLKLIIDWLAMPQKLVFLHKNNNIFLVLGFFFRLCMLHYFFFSLKKLHICLKENTRTKLKIKKIHVYVWSLCDLAIETMTLYFMGSFSLRFTAALYCNMLNFIHILYCTWIKAFLPLCCLFMQMHSECTGWGLNH